MRFEFDIELDQQFTLDLKQLIPEKFRETPVIDDLVTVLSQKVGYWLDIIEDLPLILEPNTVRFEYLRYLAYLLGLKFITADETLEDELRRELVSAVDWYKMKGTYGALETIGKLVNREVNIWDLYTNDYVNFYPTPWWIGDENENPPMYDSSYYKSPHFYFEVILDKVLVRSEVVSESLGEEGSSSTYALWVFGGFDELKNYIEKVRPVHTVPHYRLKLQLPVDQEDIPYTVYGGESLESLAEKTVIWKPDGMRVADFLAGQDSMLRYDEGNDFGRDPHHDETYYFDDYTLDMLENLSGFTLGSGHVYDNYEDMEIALTSGSWSVENPVYSKSIVTHDPYSGGPESDIKNIYYYYSSMEKTQDTLVAYAYDYGDHFSISLVVRPTENISVSEGTIFVGGQTAIGFISFPIEIQGGANEELAIEAVLGKVKVDP